MKRESFLRSLWSRLRGAATEGRAVPGSVPRREFAAIDRHARNAPRSAMGSPESLSSYLCRPAKNDVEKARAIFSWIARNIAYDAAGYRAAAYGDTSAAAVLKSGKAVCAGYANLFLRLGEAAGLRVALINGYAKGYGYTVGQSCTGANHAWNAVRANGQWHLVDSTWGAGHVDDSMNFVREFDDHYFFTPPDRFIYSHFAEQARWQLLQRPISMREFEEQVLLKPYFFCTGTSIDSHKQGTIETGSRLSVSLRGNDHFLWAATVVKNGRRLPDDNCLVQRQGGKVHIHFVFPHAGEYIARLFAKKRGHPGSYQWALDYRVIARHGASERSGYPTRSDLFAEQGAFLYEPMNRYLPAGSR